jgi:RNA polymerase III transcription factor (TF)IIIC subunit HTH domain
MFRSGPFRDMHVVHGLDPRKDSKWAGYQGVIFNFRTMPVKGGDGTEETTSHLFTGRNLYCQVVQYCMVDVLDPMLRSIIDESHLREEFHVSPFVGGV